MATSGRTFGASSARQPEESSCSRQANRRRRISGRGWTGSDVLHAYADGAAQPCPVPRSLYGVRAADDEHDLVRQFSASADAAIS